MAGVEKMDVRVEVGELLLRIAYFLDTEIERPVVPVDERDVRDRALAADEPARGLLREHAVEHAEHALRFLLVTLDRARDLF